MKRIWIHLLTLVMLLSACGIKEPSSANVIDGKSNAIEVIEGLSVEVLSNLETPTLIFYDSTVRPELTIYAINHISEQTAKKNMNIVFNVNGEEVRTTIAELMNAKDLEDMKMPDSYIDFFRKNVSIYGLIDKDTTDKMQTNIDRLITTTHLNE